MRKVSLVLPGPSMSTPFVDALSTAELEATALSAVERELLAHLRELIYLDICALSQYIRVILQYFQQTQNKVKNLVLKAFLSQQSTGSMSLVRIIPLLNYTTGIIMYDTI